MLIPIARGIAIGHSRSNRPRTAPSKVHRARPMPPNASGALAGRTAGGGRDMIPRFWGGEGVGGREEPAGDARPGAGRDRPPGKRAAAPDEHEERRSDDDRQARRAGEAEQQPGDELAPVDIGERGPERTDDLG